MDQEGDERIEIAAVNAQGRGRVGRDQIELIGIGIVLFESERGTIRHTVQSTRVVKGVLSDGVSGVPA